MTGPSDLDEDLITGEPLVLGPKDWAEGRASLRGRAPALFLGTSRRALDRAQKRLKRESLNEPDGMLFRVIDVPWRERPSTRVFWWVLGATLVLASAAVVLWLVVRAAASGATDFSIVESMTAVLLAAAAATIVAVIAWLLIQYRWVLRLSRDERLLGVNNQQHLQSRIRALERRLDEPPEDADVNYYRSALREAQTAFVEVQEQESVLFRILLSRYMTRWPRSVRRAAAKQRKNQEVVEDSSLRSEGSS